MNTTQTKTAPTAGQKRLVRQIVAALKTTNDTMFWDLNIDEDDVRERLQHYLSDYHDEREAAEEVIQAVMRRHEQKMQDAAQEQCATAARGAIASLPNSAINEPGSVNSTK